eukprot:15433572-Alexandrium_andersonii.AAC.1
MLFANAKKRASAVERTGPSPSTRNCSTAHLAQAPTHEVAHAPVLLTPHTRRNAHGRPERATRAEN